MKKPLFTLIVVSSIIFSCRKEVSELPPATQTGAMTFGARMNGNMWVPQGFGPFPASNLLEARQLVSGDILINARNFSRSPFETEFELLIKNVTGTGTYSLNTTVPYPTSAANYGYYIERNINPLNEWITSAQYTGTVNVTRFDTAAKIISGTFQFSAINLYNSPQPITVTDGRFDIKWLN